VRSFQIDEHDPKEFLGLFAAILEASKSKSAQLNKPFEVPPGALLMLSVKGSPTLSELADSVRSLQAPAHWPDFLVRQWPALKGGVFWHALEHGAAMAPALGVADGREVCRALAAVAQTLLVGSEATRARNQALARKFRGVAPPTVARPPVVPPTVAPPTVVPAPIVRAPQPAPPPPVVDRGSYIETDALIAIHASHVGPAFASKSENQDATRVVANGSDLVFALGDGVSTSLAARAAAMTIVDTVCAALARAPLGSADAPQRLIDAVDEGRRSLDDLLARFVTNPELAMAGTDLPRASAIRILDNTRTRANRHLPAALSTTLIAGIVRRTASGIEATVLRIGDGIAEHIRNAQVRTVFGMESETTQISAAVGPGADAAVPIDRSTAIQSVMLQPGDRLVISSDGLVRGHASDVWSAIAPFLGHDRWNDASASGVLERAANAADAAYHENPDTVRFDDNLSLVLIAARAH
jgi:serine/threonine protein phosphatase PrpC